MEPSVTEMLLPLALATQQRKLLIVSSILLYYTKK